MAGNDEIRGRQGISTIVVVEEAGKVSSYGTVHSPPISFPSHGFEVPSHNMTFELPFFSCQTPLITPPHDNLVALRTTAIFRNL